MEELKIRENYPFSGHIDNAEIIDLKGKCIIIDDKAEYDKALIKQYKKDTN